MMALNNKRLLQLLSKKYYTSTTRVNAVDYCSPQFCLWLVWHFCKWKTVN